MVFIHHEEMIRYYLDYSSVWELQLVRNLGKYGVVLFFVLSGFLITWLLLEEKSIAKKVDVRRFYIRRILRIWPLYYLCFIVFVVLLPLYGQTLWAAGYAEIGRHYTANVLLNIFMLPNVAYHLIGSIPFFSQAWSIGVEEQFYLIWPNVVKKVDHLKRAIVGIGVMYLFIKVAVLLIKNLYGISSLSIAYRIIDDAKIFSMAAGAYYALVIKSKEDGIVNRLLSPWTDIVMVCILIVAFINPEMLPLWNYYKYEFVSVIFAYIVASAATNSNTLFKLEYKALSYLGRISYGFYMYHIFAIYLCLVIVPIESRIIQYPVAFIVTVIMSGFSYKYYESYFLKIKKRHAIVVKAD